MGKTESGAVWLDARRTSPYHFYQYWVNVDDADIPNVLRFFTDLTEPEVNDLLAEHEKDPGKRLPQKQIAMELTRLVHGAEGLAAAEKATQIFFGAEVSQLSDSQLGPIFADVPSVEIPRAELEAGLPLVEALVRAKLAGSKGDARRTVQQGGAYVNNRPEGDLDRKLSLADLASETMIVLRSGKKSHFLLKLA